MATPQQVSSTTTPPSQASPSIKSLDPSMKQVLDQQIEYLKERNSGIKSLEYFYQIYKELYGNRTKELLHHKKQGKKIIGLYCNFVPLELILAAGAIPIRLCAGFQEPILPAEEILPRNFCPLIKSSYGFSLMDSPHFDLVDVIIVPTTCDGKKKLAEILSSQKPTWVIEVPHTSETPQARQLWLTEIKLLKKQLEKLTGNKITAKKLKRSIELVNRKRAVSRRLYELRKRTPPPIWGRDAMLVTNLALFDDIARWITRTEVLCNELDQQKPVCDVSMPRIMITGSPTVFPTWKVPILTEESGGIIVMDDICTGSKELWDPIETSNWSMNDMLIATADKYLMNTCACFTPNLTRLNRVVQFAEEFKIDGVIYHVLQACHIYGMEEQRIEKALDKIRIPVLNIETDFSQEDVEQIRTRIEAFLEMVSIRKMSKVSPATQPSVPSKPFSATPGIGSGTQPVPTAGPVPVTSTSTTITSGQAPSSAPPPSGPAVNDPTAAMTTINDPTAGIATEQASTPSSASTPASTPSSTPAPSAAPVQSLTNAPKSSPTASPTQGIESPKSAIESKPLPAQVRHPPLPPATEPEESKPESKVNNPEEDQV